MNGSFAVDLRRFAEKAEAKADEAVGAIVFNIAAELDRRSPVGDATYWKSPPPAGYVGGRFRGNWQLGVTNRPRGERDTIDTNGTIALPAIAAAIPEDASGKVYYLANNVPYAMRLETGYSRQAPQGLVAITAANFQQTVREATEALQ